MITSNDAICNEMEKHIVLTFPLGIFLPIVFRDDSVLNATNSRSSETSKSNNGTTGQRCAVVNIRQIRQTNYSEEFRVPGNIK